MLLRFAFVGVVLTLCGGSSLAFIPPFDELLRGDASNDSVVDIVDPIYIQNYLFHGGDTPACLDAADANDDGQVDNSDATYLYQFLYLGGSPPPAPYPYCGLDQTDNTENLTCDDSACS